MEKAGNHYTDLKIPRDATLEEIRAAYKSAARRFHPDVNPQAGSSDLFIHIQDAFETLSDPQKRARYDKQLGLDSIPGPAVSVIVTYSRSKIPNLTDPQLFYAQIEITPLKAPDQKFMVPLNLAFVVDRSTSMQGAKMDMVKANLIRMLRQMKPDDILSIIAFSDQAEILVPALRAPDLPRTENRVSQLFTGGGTEILHGLELGLAEIKKNLSSKRINHLILLTDGHTYGDEENCFELAKEAADLGIGISGLGLGDKWNDEFLDKLASFGGGTSMYVSAPKDLHHYLEEKFSALAQVFAENVTLEFKTDPAVELKYGFRLAPESGLLPIDSPIKLGRILWGKTLTIILEFIIKYVPGSIKEVSLINGRLMMEIPSQVVPIERINLSLDRPVGGDNLYEPPNPTILQAMSRLSLYRMQERARQEVLNGDVAKATRHLQYLATNLLSNGEKELAHSALVEAENIQKSKRFSNEGDKRLKYGTRGLLFPSSSENGKL